MLKRLIKIGDALSQLANVALLDGDANESVSGRSHRCGWRRAEAIIDAIFAPIQSRHCERAYLNDVNRARIVVAEHEARGSK